MLRSSHKLLTASAALLGASFAYRALRRWRNQMEFRNRVILITGGSRGLGLVMARQLAAKGAKLAILARDADELNRAAHVIAGRGAEVLAIPCDVTNQSEVNKAVATVVERLGRLDVLINNAGMIQVGPLGHLEVDDFEAALNIHVRAPLYTVLAALPHLRQSDAARIVNISSIGGQIAVPHLMPYSTSKFALVGLSEGMRAELAREGILVTTVCPGLMRTGSPGHAKFKGHHAAEYAWFAMFDSLPVTSINAERAARQIIDAFCHGEARLVVTIQARLAVAMNALFPNLMSATLDLTNRLLPGKAAGGDQLKDGWEARPRWMPELLTKLSDEAATKNNEVPGGHPATY